MSFIVIRLPELMNVSVDRPADCPYCGSQILQRWGPVTKPVTCAEDVTLIIYRYKCMDCNKTFRHYPEEIDQSGFSQAIRSLAAMLSVMGYSSRSIANTFDQFGVHVSHMTVWRECKEFENKLDDLMEKHASQDFSLNQEVKPGSTPHHHLFLVLDVGNGKYLNFGMVEDHTPTTVLGWLESFFDGTGVQVSQKNSIDPTLFLPSIY